MHKQRDAFAIGERGGDEELAHSEVFAAARQGLGGEARMGPRVIHHGRRVLLLLDECGAENQKLR
jgi:hypothetical protein